MSGRVNSNLAYDIVLFLTPKKYNEAIDKQYEILADKIRKLYENIQKGGMFNSDDWMDSNLQEIVNDHNSVVAYAKDKKSDYESAVLITKDIGIRATIKSLENKDGYTKKVVFNL